MRIVLKEDDKALIKLIAKNVKYFRTKLGISQDELALRADTTKSQIYRIEHAQINSSIATMGRIAKALEIRLSDLFSFE